MKHNVFDAENKGEHEDIERLEQKLDILYNVFLYIEKINNSTILQNELLHLERDVFSLVGVNKMTDHEIKLLGK